MIFRLLPDLAQVEEGLTGHDREGGRMPRERRTMFPSRAQDTISKPTVPSFNVLVSWRR
jgi:hypothetical protein